MFGKLKVFKPVIDSAKQLVGNYKSYIDNSPDWKIIEHGKTGKKLIRGTFLDDKLPSLAQYVRDADFISERLWLLPVDNKSRNGAAVTLNKRRARRWLLMSLPNVILKATFKVMQYISLDCRRL